MTGLKPDWAERIQRSRTRLYGKGYEEGSREMSRFVRLMIVSKLLTDQELKQLDTKTMARIIEIVEEA